MRYHLLTDGSSLDNPGPSGWAGNIVEMNELISGELPWATNNEAEMMTILQSVAKITDREEVVSCTDSKLVIGRLGKDSEMRYTPSGKAIITFSIATYYNNQQGVQWVNETDWHNVEMWGEAAERFNAKARKGMAVFVQGEIRYDSWTSDDGVKHFKAKITSRDATILEKTEGGLEGAAEEDGELVIPIASF